MTADDLLATVRDDNETALSRLGSSKSLYAFTGGEMEPDAVFAVAHDRATAAADTYADWADDETDDGAAALFGDAADAERERADELAGDLDDHETGDVPADLAAAADCEDTVERLGALVGVSLVDKKTAEQLTGFFTGEADPQTASQFRGYGGDYEDRRDDALDLLETACTDDEDWEDAADAAAAVVQAAYEDYVTSLEAMGVNPKPVC